MTRSIMAPKRKAFESALDRRVRARRESGEELNSGIYEPTLNDGDRESEEEKSPELEDQDEEVCTAIHLTCSFY